MTKNIDAKPALGVGIIKYVVPTEDTTKSAIVIVDTNGNYIETAVVPNSGTTITFFKEQVA